MLQKTRYLKLKIPFAQASIGSSPIRGTNNNGMLHSSICGIPFVVLMATVQHGTTFIKTVFS
jgi:hypothetical protein